MIVSNELQDSYLILLDSSCNRFLRAMIRKERSNDESGYDRFGSVS